MFQTLTPTRAVRLSRISIALLTLILLFIVYSILTIKDLPDGYPAGNYVGLGGDGFIYREAARLYTEEVPIYWVDQEWESQNPPYYMPAFFALFSPLTAITSKALFVAVWLTMLAMGYLVAVGLWKTVYTLYKPGKLTTPLWGVTFALALLSTDFWANLYYGNAVLLLVMLTAISAYGIYQQNTLLVGAAVYLTVVTKPQWAFFPAAMLLIMLLESQYRRFVLQVIGMVVGLYIAFTALMMIQTSPNYTLEMIKENVRFIGQTNSHYPYSEGLSSNSSWQQMFHLQPVFEPIADYAVLIPLVWLAHFAWTLYQVKERDIRFSSRPDLVMLVGFAGYLVAQMQVTAFMDLILGAFIVGYLWMFEEPILRNRWLIGAFVLLIITAITYVLTWYIYIPYAMILAIILYALITRILKREGRLPLS